MGRASFLARRQVLKHDALRQESALDGQGTSDVLPRASLCAKVDLLFDVGVGEDLISGVFFLAAGRSVNDASCKARLIGCTLHITFCILMN